MRGCGVMICAATSGDGAQHAVQVGGEGALVLGGLGGGAAAEHSGGTEAGAGLDLGDEAHLVHGVDAEAAVDLELAQQRQPQQRAHRVVRQRRRAAQRQPERLRLPACEHPQHSVSRARGNRVLSSDKCACHQASLLCMPRLLLAERQLWVS